MRRALVILAAVTLLLSTAALAVAADDRFPDVPTRSTHHDSIGWAGGHVVSGFADGNFRPNAYITRGQAATMFYRYNDVVADWDDPLWESFEDVRSDIGDLRGEIEELRSEIEKLRSDPGPQGSQGPQGVAGRQGAAVASFTFEFGGTEYVCIDDDDDLDYECDPEATP